MSARKPQPTGSPHPFIADPDCGEDFGGRRVCATCHLPGRPGDTHHNLPVVPEQAEHRRRIGEE